MIKAYRYTGSIDKLMHQNKAEYIDCIEGCLLDNLLISTKRGYIALMETYQNSNSSIYTLNFSTDSNEIYHLWENLERTIDE